MDSILRKRKFITISHRIPDAENQSESSFFSESSSEIYDSDESQSENQERQIVFDEVQMSQIAQKFPDYLCDVQFGGHKRMIYFDSEFFYENAEFGSNKWPAARISISWIESDVGLQNIELILRGSQFKYIQKLLQSQYLENNHAYNLLDFIYDDYKQRILLNEYKKKYRIECLDDIEFGQAVLTKKVSRELCKYQKEILEKDYSDSKTDVKYLLHLLFVNDCIISVDNEVSFVCDTASTGKDYVKFNINCFNEIIPQMASHVFIFKKDTVDPNYGRVKNKYYYEKNYLKAYIPYFAKVNLAFREFAFFDRDYKTLVTGKYETEMPEFDIEIRFFDGGNSPLYGGDTKLLKAISDKISQSVLKSFTCLNNNPCTEKLLRLHS